MIIRGLIFLAVAGVFYWDGLYAWPERNKIVEAYFEYIENDGSVHDWPRYAEEELRLEPPLFTSIRSEYKHEDLKNREKLNEQLYIAAIFTVLGLLFFGKIFLDRNKALQADAEKVIAPDGTELRFDDIKLIDDRKWAKQGLAYLRYDENNEPQKVVLDDLKYDGAEKVLERAKKHAGPTVTEREAQARAAEEDTAESEDAGEEHSPRSTRQETAADDGESDGDEKSS
jgi:hypothetical protein